jgi:Asp-tRNA(Asn)/Glu-tRNA(Gln) amidotransferase A subunit family amidase
MAARQKTGAATEALLGLGAIELRDRIAKGALRAADLVQACLTRIAAVEPQVQAWAWLDSDDALSQAQALDRLRLSGRPIGPLHGLPVALKDVIDTRRIPTTNGTVLDEGRVPVEDAFIVQRLKAAGAIILGKTVSTELAFMQPGKTRNPHDHARTPGGSSSGSAVAVASGMVPLAIGTQTGGSVIRPASFCGVVGYKPTFGAIPRTGVLTQSPSLDTVGVFARSAEDAALIAEVLFGHDAGDRATSAMPPQRLVETCLSKVPVRPTFAFVRPPSFDQASSEVQEGLSELASFLGEYAFEAGLANVFAEASAVHRRINFAEMAKCYYAYERKGRDQLSEVLRNALDEGKQVLARDYISALDWPDVLYAGLEEVFERCDAIIVPAATGAAPMGLESTGSPVFNSVWSLCRVPCITLPLLESADGLPIGVQLIGRRGDDARLLRTARWLADAVARANREEEAA